MFTCFLIKDVYGKKAVLFLEGHLFFYFSIILSLCLSKWNLWSLFPNRQQWRQSNKLSAPWPWLEEDESWSFSTQKQHQHI